MRPASAPRIAGVSADSGRVGQLDSAKGDRASFPSPSTSCRSSSRSSRISHLPRTSNALVSACVTDAQNDRWGALAALSLTSRELRTTVQPYLYETVRLCSELSSSQLLRTLAGRPDLASLVRRLYIGARAGGPDGAQLVAMCDRLETLHVPDSAYVVRARQTVTRLAFSKALRACSLVDLLDGRQGPLESVTVALSRDDTADVFGHHLHSAFSRLAARSSLRLVDVDLPQCLDSVAAALCTFGSVPTVFLSQGCHRWYSPDSHGNTIADKQIDQVRTVRLAIGNIDIFYPPRDLFEALSACGPLPRFTSLREIHLALNYCGSIASLAFAPGCLALLPPSLRLLAVHSVLRSRFCPASNPLLDLSGMFFDAPFPARWIVGVETKLEASSWHDEMTAFAEACLGPGVGLWRRDESAPKDHPSVGRRDDTWCDPYGESSGDQGVAPWKGVEYIKIYRARHSTIGLTRLSNADGALSQSLTSLVESLVGVAQRNVDSRLQVGIRVCVKAAERRDQR